jgi:hypothetical protein
MVGKTRRCNGNTTRSWILLFLVAILGLTTNIGVVDCFQISNQKTQNTLIPKTHIQFSSTTAAATTTTALNAKDQKTNVVNKKTAAAPEAKEREKNDGIGLLFLYMTPWKNPNSIFVYMLLILYGLGKYSEAHSAASNTL